MTSDKQNVTIDEAIEKVEKDAQFVIDLDKLTPITHRWVDRGAKLTCENAGHPYHEAWKRQK